MLWFNKTNGHLCQHSRYFSFEIVDGADVTEIIDTKSTHAVKGWQQPTSRSVSTYWSQLQISSILCLYTNC